MSAHQPGGAVAPAVQQVVSLQEAIERAEDGGTEEGRQGDGSSSG